MKNFSFRRNLPFCIQEVTAEDVGEDTDLPVGVARGKLFKWLRRVKKWKVTVTGGAAISEGGDPAFSISVAGASLVMTVKDPDGDVDLEREEKYACAGSRVSGEIRDSSAEGLGSFITVEPLRLSFVAAYRFEDLYYVGIEMGWRAILEFLPGSTDVVEQVSKATYDAAEPPLFKSATTVTVDGEEFQIYHVGELNAGPGQSFAPITAIDINPEEYWPWDPEDGDGPVVDAETGDILRQLP